MATCAVCGVTSPLISRAIGVCRKCLKEREERALEVALSNHRRYRAEFGLPPDPPRTPGGIPCNLCAARCVMGEGELGYCGIRGVKGGKLWSLSTPEKGLLHYYLDPHVTNCCNAWWCPAATGCGYPKYAVAQGPETGYYNLALFFYGCSFNCLFYNCSY
jgi:pyruvate formate lyase activating enzyme